MVWYYEEGCVVLDDQYVYFVLSMIVLNILLSRLHIIESFPRYLQQEHGGIEFELGGIDYVCNHAFMLLLIFT